MNQGLVSLDVQIPRRGQVFRFTTPRGDAQITAQTAAVPLVDNLERLAVVAGVIVVFYLVYRLAKNGKLKHAFSTRIGSLIVLLIGLISLFAWLLPFIGMLLVVVGIVLLVRAFQLKQAPAV
jgi:hypothetical protein